MLRRVLFRYRSFPKTNISNKFNASFVDENVRSMVTNSVINQEIIPSTNVELYDVGSTSLQQTPSIELGPDTLSHFGLDTFWPAGIVRQCLQDLHQMTGLPYGEVIIIGVIAGRILFLPLVLKTIRFSDQMTRLQEPMQKHVEELRRAQKSGDMFQQQLAFKQMSDFYSTNNFNPFSGILKILPQSIFLTSYYWGISKMASAPLASFKIEGMLNFTDLTLPCPALSICCSTLLYLILKDNSAVEGVVAPPGMDIKVFQKIVTVLMPLGVLICTWSIPSAVVLYWCTSNVFSLILCKILKRDRVRQVLKLPALKKPSAIDKKQS